MKKYISGHLTLASTRPMCVEEGSVRVGVQKRAKTKQNITTCMIFNLKFILSQLRRRCG